MEKYLQIINDLMQAWKKASNDADKMKKAITDATEKEYAIIDEMKTRAGGSLFKGKQGATDDEKSTISECENAIKKAREKETFYRGYMDVLKSECMRVAKKAVIEFFRDNMKTFDGVPVRYKKVTDAIAQASGGMFELYRKYNGMYADLYVYSGARSAGTGRYHIGDETLYITCDGYKGSSNWDCYINAAETEREYNRYKDFEPRTAEELKKATRDAFRASEKIAAIMAKAEKEKSAIMATYSNGNGGLYEIAAGKKRY